MTKNEAIAYRLDTHLNPNQALTKSEFRMTGPKTLAAKAAPT